MSKLGDIYNSNAKEFKLAVANTSVKTLLETTSLPHNTLIISAQQDSNGNDTDTSCLIITDDIGSPVRLTYQFIPGNGIIIDDNYIYIGIDNTYIYENENGQLTVNNANFVDNKTLRIVNNKIAVNVNELNPATTTNAGLVKIDDDTIGINGDNQLYAITNNLLYTSYGVYGIGKGDNKTVLATDGVLSVNTDNLDKANKNKPGIVKPDNKTISINENGLHIITANLNYATANTFGIGTGDGKTILTKDGVIGVQESGLTKCSNTTAGVIKLDSDTLTTNKDVVELLDSNLFGNTLYTDLLNELDEMYDKILNLTNIVSSGPSILSIAFNSTSATSLPKNERKNNLLTIPKNDVYIFMNIKTLSNFTVNITFINNVAPMCEVNEVLFNNKTECVGNAQGHVFPGTGGEEQRLVIHITCYNYKSSKLANKLTTSVKINISDATNTNNYKNAVYSIIRYNLTPNVVDTGNDEIETTTFIYEANLYTSYWKKNLNDISKSSKIRLAIAQNALTHIKK